MELLLYVKTILRIVVIVCTVLTVTVSAVTIGVIDNNSVIQSARQSNSSDSASVRDLANNTLAAAAWLIILGISVILWEVLHALVPTAASRSSLIQRYTVVLMIADAVFSMGAMLCYLSTGVACAVYADSWGEPPLAACNRPSNSHIKGSNGASAFFCLLQLPVLLALTVLAIITGFPQLLLLYKKFSKTADEEQLQCEE